MFCIQKKIIIAFNEIYKMKISVLIFFGVAFLISCNNQRVQKKSAPDKKNVIISIQPFDDLPASYANAVYTSLKEIYSSIELKKPIPFPNAALNINRTRYRADSLIRMLSNHTADGYLTIGLTTKDISTTKGAVLDWGIMGLGFCPGKACIASTFRLHKEQRLSELFKVAIHELGHTQGLKHCIVKTCFMRDAEGKNQTNEEKEFCLDCKKVLVAAGWKLK